MTYLILSLIALSLFISYNIAALVQFGVPWSLSRTYYLYEEKRKGLGWLFTGMMWSMALILAPCMLAVSTAIGPWMSYFTFLAFFTVAGIIFVGAAPRYYEDLEGIVHMTSAKICAVAALLWCFLVCWSIWFVPIIAALIPVALGFITKSWKSGRDYWIEMMAFDATFATAITEIILVLL